MTVKLPELLATGDALCEGGDLASLMHVVAEIERVAAALPRPDLETARAALDRWALRARDRQLEIRSALAGYRVRRGALLTYGAVASA